MQGAATGQGQQAAGQGPLAPPGCLEAAPDLAVAVDQADQVGLLIRRVGQIPDIDVDAPPPSPPRFQNHRQGILSLAAGKFREQPQPASKEVEIACRAGMDGKAPALQRTFREHGVDAAGGADQRTGWRLGIRPSRCS